MHLEFKYVALSGEKVYMFFFFLKQSNIHLNKRFFRQGSVFFSLSSFVHCFRSSVISCRNKTDLQMCTSVPGFVFKLRFLGNL